MLKPEDIDYTALFVNSPEELLEMFPAKHTRAHANHSTNWYRPTSLEGLEIGKESLLKIIGEVYDQNAFALLVENAKSRNRYPHITISCTEETSAAYSNDLFQRASIDSSLKLFQVPLFIEVTEGYYDMYGNKVLL
jgi:hypothetical protein